MIEWQDLSEANGARYVWSAASLSIDLVRYRRELWSIVIRYGVGLRIESRGWTLDALLCDDDAKARALALAKPIAEALAERSAAVARDIAVMVAGARLDGVA